MSRALLVAHGWLTLVTFLLLLCAPTSASAQRTAALVRFDTDGGWLHVSRVVGYQRRTVVGTAVREGYVGPYVSSVSEPVLSPICDAPCDAVLPTGFVRLALEDMRGSLLTAPFQPVSGATYRVRVDRHDTRSFGFLISILGWTGTIAGGVLTGLSYVLSSWLPSPEQQVAGWSATAGSLAMALVGMPLAAAGDGAHVERIAGAIRF